MIKQTHFWVYIQKKWKQNFKETSALPCSLQHYSQWPRHRNSLNAWVCGLVIKSYPTLVTPQTIACQTPLSMGFSRQEYWSGLPLPSPGGVYIRVSPSHLGQHEYTLRAFAKWNVRKRKTNTEWYHLNVELKKKKSQGLSWWPSGEESICPFRRHELDAWLGKIPHAAEQLSPCATTIEPGFQSPKATTTEAHAP